MNNDQLKMAQKAIDLMLSDDSTRAELTKSERKTALDAYATLDRLIDGETIGIYWCVEDVQSLDETMSEADCIEVLKIVDDKHDATIGVNWDTLEAAISLHNS